MIYVTIDFIGCRAAYIQDVWKIMINLSHEGRMD